MNTDAIIGGIILTLVIFLLLYRKAYVKPKSKAETENKDTGVNTGGGVPPFGILATIVGIVLSAIAFNIDARGDPDFANVINLHRLFIKQTLYFFSGVSFIISAISFATNKISEAISKQKKL